MFALTITYDTSRPNRSLSAYRISLTDIGDDGAPEPLLQSGPVQDSIVRYSGRFPSLAAAVAEVEAFIDVPFYALVRQSHYGEDYYALREANFKGGYDARTDAVTYVLMRKTAQGVYHSHEVSA